MAFAACWLALLVALATGAGAAETRGQDGAQSESIALAELRLETEALEARERELATELERENARLEALRAQVEVLERSFTNTRNRLDIAGLTDTVGPLLRRERAKLPSSSSLRDSRRQSHAQSSDAQLERLDLAEELDELSDPRGYAVARLHSAGEQTLAADPDLVQPLVDAARSKRAALVAAGSRLDGLVSVLLEFEALEDRLAAVVADYRDFIDERVLWIASARPAWRGWWPDERGEGQQISGLVGGLLWVGSAHQWWEVSEVLVADARANPEKAGLGLLAVLALLAARRPALRRLRQEAGEAQRRSNFSMLPTLRALLWTALAAAPAPVLLTVVGWRLDRGSPADSFGLALGHALTEIASTLFAVQFLRLLCHPEGLGARHFDWPTEPMRRVRREIFLLASIAVPAEAVHALFQAHGVSAWYDTVGRYALALHLAMLALFFLRILPSRKEAAANPAMGEASNQSAGFLAKLSTAWLILGVGTPSALLLLALAGYLFTAAELLQPLQFTILFFVALTVIEAVVMRWVRLAQRRLWMARMRERREAARQAAERDAGTPEEGAPIAEEPPLDLDQISGETTQLLHAASALLALLGIYFLWAPSVPALGLLSELGVYSVAGQERLEEGGTRTTLVDVTVADLAGGLLLILVLGMAFRRVPSLLEITLLQRLRLGAGERNAVVTLTKYAIVLVGIVWLSGVLGISWSKLQWMVAAISVGLGFGLQEIFGNFVSGLILLFERPIRVGDIVSVGGVDGRVTKMRIRATTITDFDRRELIVPNKEFVTGQLINWTLSDPITRIRIPVGIAYGSDTAKARELLLEIATSSEFVLADPPPRATFLGFGDNSLDFKLFVFIPTRDVYLDTMQDLHFRIDQEFRRAGIEIAFPQRDLHLRSAPALEQLVREWRGTGDEPGTAKSPPKE